MTADDFSNPLKKYKLVFLGEQSGKSSLISLPVAMAMSLSEWKLDDVTLEYYSGQDLAYNSIHV